MKDGSRHAETVESARGSEHRFASPADVIGKFEFLAGKALPAARIAQLRDTVLGLEEVPQAAEIGRLMCRPESLVPAPPAKKRRSR